MLRHLILFNRPKTGNIVQPQFSDSINEEIAKFQGAWIQIRSEADGITNPEDEFGANPLTTFVGNTYVVTLPDGTIVINGYFTLDPIQEPKAVN